MALWGRMLERKIRSSHYDRGIRFFDQGLYAQAIEAFQEALDEPNHGTLVDRLTRFYLAESFSALALAHLASWDGGSRRTPNADRAIENLQRAIELSPTYADLHCNLGRAYLSEARNEEAIPVLRRALEINPNYARAELYMGVALYGLGQHTEGISHVERALALDATLRKEWLPKARAAEAEGDADTAIFQLVQIGETEEDDGVDHARIAYDLYNRGMLDEAATEYRSAIAIHPNYPDLRNQLGVTLYAAGKDAEAVVEFARAIQINPRYVEAHVNSGLALERMGRVRDAIAAFDAVIRLDPDHPVAQEHRDALTSSAISIT